MISEKKFAGKSLMQIRILRDGVARHLVGLYSGDEEDIEDIIRCAGEKRSAYFRMKASLNTWSNGYLLADFYQFADACVAVHELEVIEASKLGAVIHA